MNKNGIQTTKNVMEKIITYLLKHWDSSVLSWMRMIYEYTKQAFNSLWTWTIPFQEATIQ